MTGVGRYLISLLDSVEDDKISNELIIYSIKPNATLLKKRLAYSSLEKLDFLPHKLLSFLWVQIIFPFLVYLHKPKVIIYPNNISSFFLKSKGKKILILHDLFYKINKEYHDSIYNKYLELSLRRALKINDLIICVSHNTKSDLVKYYNVDVKKIAVLYPYVDRKFHPLNKAFVGFQNIQTKFGIKKPFLLFVGKLETRKNITGIIEIASLLKTKGINIQTVLVGNPGHGFNIIKRKIDISDLEILHLTNITDQELILLYNLAAVFIFPSYYEGFGYPVLEAMQCGCPVAVSNCPALAEVVGANGLKIEANDYRKFSEVIVRLLTDEEYRAEHILDGITQSNKFNAERMKTEFIEILEKNNK